MIPDIRARVYCSLGTLIDGEIADTYAQGSGLIRCRGSVRLKGSYSPPHGTKLYFAVYKNGRLSRINRELRVLSSFTHPFTQVTTVQIGCTLTYYENRSEAPITNPDVIFAVNDPVNADFPCPLRKYASLRITANYIFGYCCQKLGLTHSNIFLSNQFSRESFSFDQGYVSIMDGLLISENYIAYVDGFGVLRGKKISGIGGLGPVLDETNIISVEGINSGELPGEGVFVRYSTKKLKEPEVEEEGEEDKSGVEEDGTIKRVRENRYYVGEAVDTYSLFVENGLGGGQRETVTRLFQFQGKEETIENYDSRGRLKFRQSISSEPFGDNIATTNIYYPSVSSVGSTDQLGGSDSFERLDACGLPLPVPEEEATDSGSPRKTTGPRLEITTVTGPALDACRRCGYDGSGFSAPIPTMIKEKRVVTYSRSSRVTFTDEQVLIPYYQTPHGSVAVDREMQARQDAATNQTIYIGDTGFGEEAGSGGYVEGVTWDIGFQGDVYAWATGLVEYGSSQKTRAESNYGLQAIAPADEVKNILNSANSIDDPDPLNPLSENGPDVEESVELAWALGGPQSDTKIEFSMPFAPEDVVVWNGGDDFSVQSGNAREAALAFGRTQNRLLLGNRNGLSLQIPFENMPPEPLSPVYISANNIVGSYMTNGSVYAFSGNGIICSTDALFWGAVGSY